MRCRCRYSFVVVLCDFLVIVIMTILLCVDVVVEVFGLRMSETIFE